MSQKPWYQGLVDVERYPITDPTHPKIKALINTYQAELKAAGAVEIPHFVTPAGLERLVAESITIEDQAFHNHLVGNAYLDDPDPSLPSDHARKMTEPTSLGALGYDQIPPTHLLRQIYEWDALMSFLGAIMGEDKLYRYADPMGALNISVMKKGDYLRWHFDQADFVSSLSIRNSEVGGDFEYVPMIRNEKEEHYDKVRNLIRGGTEGVVHLANHPGSLVLFKGRYSIHRVTEIQGETSRLIGLFGYDTKPGTMSSDYLRKIRYGRTTPLQ